MAKKLEGDSSVNPDYYKRDFENRAEWPLSWYSMALVLIRAAELIWKQVEQDKALLMAGKRPATLREGTLVPKLPVHEPFMLLAGLALENLAKAIISKEHDMLDAKGRLKKQWKTHGLLKLIEKAGVNLEKKELRLAQDLEQFIEWSGRYPCPLDYMGLLPRTTPEGGVNSPHPGVSGAAAAQWRNIVKAMRRRLDLDKSVTVT